MRYVQLVEKNGRIKKNEQYELYQFINLLESYGLFSGTWTLNKKKLKHNLLLILNAMIEGDDD